MEIPHDTPWKVDENADKQDRQEKKEETKSLLLRILTLPTATTAEGNGVADCGVPGINISHNFLLLTEYESSNYTLPVELV